MSFYNLTQLESWDHLWEYETFHQVIFCLDFLWNHLKNLMRKLETFWHFNENFSAISTNFQTAMYWYYKYSGTISGDIPGCTTLGSFQHYWSETVNLSYSVLSLAPCANRRANFRWQTLIWVYNIIQGDWKNEGTFLDRQAIYLG